MGKFSEVTFVLSVIFSAEIPKKGVLASFLPISSGNDGGRIAESVDFRRCAMIGR